MDQINTPDSAPAIVPAEPVPVMLPAKKGRPSKSDLEVRKKLERHFMKRVGRHVQRIADHYVNRAFASDKVLLDARRVLAPDENNGQLPAGGFNITIVNFDKDRPPPILKINDEFSPRLD